MFLYLYRGVLFQVDGNNQFRTLTQDVFNGNSPHAGTLGLSDFNSATSGVTTPYLTLINDVEDSILVQGTTNLDNSVAPFKPGSTTDRFDQWEYYYTYQITLALDNLGFDDDGSLGWPRIIDDN